MILFDPNHKNIALSVPKELFPVIAAIIFAHNGEKDDPNNQYICDVVTELRAAIGLMDDC